MDSALRSRLFEKIILAVESIEKVYDRSSPFYDLLFGRVSHGGRQKAPELLQLRAGDRLLEVGVGTGLSIPEFPEHVEITGVDVSQGMLDKAEKRMQDLGRTNVQLVKMDASQLEFEDDTFDAVLAAYVISTVPDPIKVVEEMKRVCKADGTILFLNHFRSRNKVVGMTEKLLSPLFWRVGFQTNLDLRELQEQTGLTAETRSKLDFMGLWTAVRCFNP